MLYKILGKINQYMMRNKFKELTAEIVKESLTAICNLKDKYPNHNFYIFVLSMFEDGSDISGSINSEEDFGKFLKYYSVSSNSEDAVSFRWDPSEWVNFEYKFNFENSSKIIENLFEKMREDHSDLYYNNLMDSMTSALIEIRESAVLPHDTVYFCHSPYANDPDEIEESSAQIVNNGVAYKIFQNRLKCRVPSEKLESNDFGKTTIDDFTEIMKAKYAYFNSKEFYNP